MYKGKKSTMTAEKIYRINLTIKNSYDEIHRQWDGKAHYMLEPSYCNNLVIINTIT